MAQATQITPKGQEYLDGVRSRGLREDHFEENIRFIVLTLLEDGPLTATTFNRLLFERAGRLLDNLQTRRDFAEVFKSMYGNGYIEFTEVDI